MSILHIGIFLLFPLNGPVTFFPFFDLNNDKVLQGAEFFFHISEMFHLFLVVSAVCSVKAGFNMQLVTRYKSH